MRYISVYDSRPKGYPASNSAATEVLEAECGLQASEGWTKWDRGPGDFINLIQFIESTKSLDRHILEIGTYFGSSAGVLVRYLSYMGIRKTMHLVDVFDGFIYLEAQLSADAHWTGTHKTDGVDALRQRLVRSSTQRVMASGVLIRKINIFTDEIPDSILKQGLCLATLDVDLYEAVVAGLKKVAPHVVRRGVIVVEDAGHTPLLSGAPAALSELLEIPEGREFFAVEMGSGQVALVEV
ncbi:MAG: hypothetical protein OSA11_09715 [Candidatus Nanopelagicales bacterium]|nr:hypothetical protein [Candidatus Nanopelagicales bacterium]